LKAYWKGLRVDNSTVQIDTGTGKTFSAYLARPDRPNGVAIVILQEIFGVNANIRSVADAYADGGYIAIAPDIFWRQEPNVELDPANAQDREQAARLLQGLDQALAVADALSAAAFARALPGANGKVAAVGYCLGGKLAFMLATQPGVDAVISYYGVAIQTSLDAFASLQCPVLLHVAGDDHLCPPPAQAAIAQAAAGAEKATILLHPGVGHAFARRGGTSFDADAAARADAASASFLEGAVG
jgi:carboxymethylenebutenolidase